MLKAIIVDDEVNAVRAMEMILQIFFPNISVLKSFSNSLHAVDFIQENQFDILFLDLDMPHFNGIQLLEKFKERNFKVFVVSANQILVMQAKLLNADAFFSKPLDNEDLAEIIQKNFPDA